MAQDRSLIDRIDPEVREGMELVFQHTGPAGLSGFSLPARREFYNAAGRVDDEFAARFAHVARTDHWIPGHNGGKVRVRMFRRSDLNATTPGVLLIHGGGMNMGSIESDEKQALALTEATREGIVVVSVDYRLAPEFAHPYPVEDSYAALTWMYDSADALDIDASRIGLYGESAGGGIAAALGLMARDRGGPPIAFQMLIYPMLDDRNITVSSHDFAALGVWTRALNVEAWNWLLGGPEHAEVDRYAAPARATDLSGLPPTYLDVGDLDLFRDEVVQFAAALMRDRVPVELHVYPGGVHGSEIWAPRAALSTRIMNYRRNALDIGLS